MSDPASDLKQELLAAAERQQGHAPAPADRRRWRGHLGRSRLLLTAATVAIAAVVALLVTASWDSSPGFLERAEAALAPPPGTVLHEEINTTSTWTRRACRVTGTQLEVWIDTTPPHSYRALQNRLPPDPASTDPRRRPCSGGPVSEFGGTYLSSQALRFVPPNRLSPSAVQIRFPLNPTADLRAAISAGRVHDEGKTQLDGRTVERIRIDTACPPRANCPRGPVYLYVDPETFYPVEIVATFDQVEIVGGPGTSSYSHVRVRDVTRYATFEYLPRTAANLALTDIRAQHPNATGP